MFWFLLLGFGVMVLTYLLTMFYMRGKQGVQPGYKGLVIMSVSMVCVLAAALVLQRSGVDLRSERPREILWIALGVLWLFAAGVIAYQRTSSGSVLMDFG